MADRFFGVNVGSKGSTESVLEQGTTTSRSIEVRLTYDATGMNKVEALRGLQALMDYITKDNWPPV